MYSSVHTSAQSPDSSLATVLSATDLSPALSFVKALREEMLRTSFSLMMEELWIRPNGTLLHWEIKQALFCFFFLPDLPLKSVP